MTEPPVPPTALSEGQRAQAHTRFMIIRPALEDGVAQANVARTHNIPPSTVQRWVKRYREKGLYGLADTKTRSDKGTSRRLPPHAITLVEELALQTPPRSTAAIHRQVTAIAQEQGWDPPSYARVRQIIKNLDIAGLEGVPKMTVSRVRMIDVARLAGVSKTTVSRVLNHKPDVDPATRERILQIIEEQGFVPSIAASGLASGRRSLIGMLVPSWIWPLIPELMRGVAEVIEQTPYELVLYSINDADLKKDRSEVINRVLATQLTAGLLAVYPGEASQDLTRLYNQGFPVVIIDDQRGQTTPWVGADNVTGAYVAVRHLISLGHQRIAHITGPQKYLVSHERYNGYRQALLEAGIIPDPDLVLEGDFMPPTGRACASKFFELPLDKRPTAIFAATDQMAYGVIAAAEDYGLAVPGDLALVGFDDDTPSAHVRPALTTIRQPNFEMGQQGIKLLLSLLDISGITGNGKWTTTLTEKIPGGADQATRSIDGQLMRIQLPTSLVVRESCGSGNHISILTSME
jgi:LacI family transcriptional regulator, galactose operon repressor